MIETIRIDDQFMVGKAHPGEADLRELARSGVKSVVNLRTAAEEKQPQSPDEEGRLVRDLGMAYLHQPVAADAMKPDLVDEFRARLRDLPRPVFLHCASGQRSGAFTMMHIAVERGMSGEQTLEQAEKMGFECDTPELEGFVKNYVDRHRAAG